jgi:hypothetical protein
MFGWTYQGHWTAPPEMGFVFGASFEIERVETPGGYALWLRLTIGGRWWSWRRLVDINRETGPKDNRSVLSWFWRGAERRPKGVTFSDGFAQAAKRPPLKRIR